jgi:hypothetical protein
MNGSFVLMDDVLPGMNGRADILARALFADAYLRIGAAGAYSIGWAETTVNW